MKGYSVFAFAYTLILAQKSPDNSIPCDLWPPGAAPDSCFPPDPHPFLHFTVVVCFGTALGLLVGYLGGLFDHRKPPLLSEEEGRLLSERVSEALRLVSSLRGAALRKQCRMIVSGLLRSVDFTLRSVREYYVDHEPEEKAVLECMAAVLRSGRHLRLHLQRTRNILRYPPLVSRASRRTLEAARQYEELVELVKRCNSRLPDSANALPILELKPAECCGNWRQTG